MGPLSPPLASDRQDMLGARSVIAGSSGEHDQPFGRPTLSCSRPGRSARVGTGPGPSAEEFLTGVWSTESSGV